jgi:hypothetical protein
MRFKFIVSTLAFAMSASAGAQGAASVANVPENLKPSANESVAMVVAAKGVQIYECRPVKNQADAYEWALVAPLADLFDASGNKVGIHYAGPHWESLDGSRIVGAAKASADAPQPGAIPWVLLAAKSDGGAGAFSKVTSVQRVNTVGGVPPRTGCSQTAAGTMVRVPYAADYYFLAAKDQVPSQVNAVANPLMQPRSSYSY